MAALGTIATATMAFPVEPLEPANAQAVLAVLRKNGLL